MSWPATAISQPLQIGDWWIDPAANEVTSGSESARIEPKAMQVLTVLADHRGQVVSREELLSKVWPGVIVGDEALTQTIIKLRKALGDSSRSPRYIETISKRGYRLVAAVQTVAPGASNPIGAAPPPLARPTQVSARWLALVAVAVLCIGAAYILVTARNGAVDADAVSAKADPFRNEPITLTVMPFESLSADGEQTYLARGIGNDLMTDLSRLSTLSVISPSAGAPTDPSASRVRYLVRGSVQRESATLRINIALVDTATNQQLWSERFERPFDNLFAVQDEIVTRLTELLSGKLSEAERQRLARRYTRNLDAYDAFLQAQALFLVRQAGVNEEARALYRKALALDPRFARAYAGLAMTYAMDHRLRPPGELSSTLTRAFELAESARMIDPDIPEVYWALGFVHVQSRRHQQAIEALQKAIELNPSYADAYAFLGGIHTYLGESSKTIPLLRTALRLNPDGGYLYFLILGRAYFYEGDNEQAIINLREAAARNPTDIETRVYLAAASAVAGDRAAAEWEAVELRALDAKFSTQDWLRTYPMSNARYTKQLTDRLAQAGL